MNRHIYTLAILGLALSGCSGVDSKRASGDFEYANQLEASLISVPAPLKTPTLAKDYYVSNDINHEGPIGENVDIRAPSLALPIAASSRVDPKSQQAMIWFDQVFDDKNLADFIFAAITSELADDNVDRIEVDDSKYIVESGWYQNEQEVGYWLFEEMELVDQQRFRFQVSPKPHGRSASLAVELVEYENSKNPEQKIDIIDKRRAEMHMLNEVVAQVDYSYRQLQREKRIERAKQKMLSIGENKVGEPAYVVEMELDSLWQNLPSFFEDYGFTISDLNETKKIYFVDFTKPENGFWSSIWGDEVPVIDVADAKYQFVLEELDKSTVLTIYNSDGDPVTSDVLTRIFPVMESGLSFRNAF